MRPSAVLGDTTRFDPTKFARVSWSVADALPDGLTLFEPMFDAAGHITDFTYAYVNPAGAGMVGRSPADLIGCRMTEEFPSVRTTGIFNGYCQAWQSGTPWQHEVLYDQDGIAVGFRLSAARVGSILAVSYADISARLRAERQRDRLLDHATRLQQITAHLAAAVSGADVAAVVAAHVQDLVGAAFVSILLPTPGGDALQFLGGSGLSAAAREQIGPIAVDTPRPAPMAFASGRAIIVTSMDDMRARFSEAAPVAARLGVAATASIPLCYNTQTLGVIAVDFAASQIPDADTLALLTAIAEQCALALERARLLQNEVDMRRALEAALERVSRTSQEKSAFLAELSHEVRTPLQSIMGYTDALLVDPTNPPRAEQRHRLERVQSNATRIRRLVDDVLEFSRLEGGDVALAPELVSVERALTAAEAVVLPQRLAAKIEFKTDLDGAPDAIVWADSYRLQQILINLLTNGIKFTPAGGCVSVSITSVKPSATDALAAAQHGPCGISIAVRDTGVGIPGHQLEAIFAPFVQVSGTHAAGGSGGRGFGLGLSISRQLARRMGGDLTATSSLGDGSTFTLVLPAAPPP